MNHFSISDLQKYSGIKAHTIRVWEQRYHALQPDRSEGNTRFYNSTQLKRLLNIVSLLNSGMKVSELCARSDEQLKDLLEVQLKQALAAGPPYDYFINQVVSSALTFDEDHFNKIFSDCMQRFGMKETYVSVLYPVILRLGLMWTVDELEPVQEHFITGLIRRKLLAATDALPLAASPAKKWILFLPENEYHEIGLLFASYLLCQSGNKVIYLGPDVPLEPLSKAVEITSAENILCFLVNKDNEEDDERYILELERKFRDKKIFVSCSSGRLQDFRHSRKTIFIHSVNDLEKHI